MARPRLISQENENYCLCSILQGILATHGIRFSQGSIAANLTSFEHGHLYDDERIKEFLRSSGFDYSFYWHNQTPFNDPAKLLGNISANEGFIGIGLHAYRILSFPYPELIVDDPKDASRKRFNLSETMQELAKVGGGFGLIKKVV